MERAKSLRVNAGTVPDADLGPVISKQVIMIHPKFSFSPFLFGMFIPYMQRYAGRSSLLMVSLSYKWMMFCSIYSNSQAFFDESFIACIHRLRIGYAD